MSQTHRVITPVSDSTLGYACGGAQDFVFLGDDGVDEPAPNVAWVAGWWVWGARGSVRAKERNRLTVSETEGTAWIHGMHILKLHTSRP